MRTFECCIYLDHDASTPCDPRVVEAMLPCFSEHAANPSNGLHRAGRRAARLIEVAREKVAALLGAEPSEVVFTSGATESNNLALLGCARAAAGTGRVAFGRSNCEADVDLAVSALVAAYNRVLSG
ncbi:MAG: aminotransferase class V-fold PLP-dependent enzyme [Candidatus Schekmanbacteria bacterium]|nr:aminotransferase class V-fold PLP-dependent enzyme [Candidatus Schekmanbacteria bacterium]